MEIKTFKSNKKIRVLIVTHDLNIGGLQQIVYNLCSTIDRDVFHVTVLCLWDLGPLAKDIESLGIKIILLSKKTKKTDYLSFLKVSKIIKDYNIDILHTHNTPSFFDGVLGMLCTYKKAKVIHTDHGRIFPDKRRYMFAEWLLSHFAYKVVGVSSKTTYNINNFEKISINKLMTIENGINSNHFMRNIDRNKKCKELDIPIGIHLIGIISRLVEVKGINYLIEALPEIDLSFKNYKLLVIGDGSERINLEKLVFKLKLEHKVVFLGNRRDVNEIYPILSLFVLPSLSEGLPMGLLESLASGCPIVASNVGGIPDVIQDNENGLLVEPKNPKQLARAILRLLSNSDLRSKLAENGKKVFLEKYSSEIMTKKYEKLYLDCLLR